MSVSMKECVTHLGSGGQESDRMTLILLMNYTPLMFYPDQPQDDNHKESVEILSKAISIHRPVSSPHNHIWLHHVLGCCDS
jgi:hypothetical protein